jgi:2,3-bisphosphoglycerate-independent phosphoglycerate mutase
MGLCSPGGVHSSLDHLYALVDLLHASGLEVFLHALLDGRDTPPRSARGYLAEIERQIQGKAKVATVIGRFYTMDRDQRWERVERGYRAHVYGEGQQHHTADEAIAAAYDSGENDEFVTPRVIVDQEARPIGTIDSGDGVFFFNFRADRAREITTAITVDDFDYFNRGRRPQLASYICMTEYKDTLQLPVAFPPIALDNILGEILAEQGLHQLRAAETEKYAHVTFFFNGGVETPFAGESRKLIPSPKEVATYDLKPQMSAREVADAVIEHLAGEQTDFVLVNFANGDMVGHTGVLEAAVRAAETVDEQVGRIVTVVRDQGGSVIVTADHGNLEKMRDEETGQPHTAHTTNPVPFILVDEGLKDGRLRSGGSLRDVAPTVLDLLHIKQPLEMTGKTLIVR